MSFRQRLMLLTALAIAVTVAGASAAVWVVSKHELYAQVNQSLGTQASLAAASGHDQGPFGGPIVYNRLAPDGDVIHNTLAVPITARQKQVATDQVCQTEIRVDAQQIVCARQGDIQLVVIDVAHDQIDRGIRPSVRDTSHDGVRGAGFCRESQSHACHNALRPAEENAVQGLLQRPIRSWTICQCPLRWVSSSVLPLAELKLAES